MRRLAPLALGLLLAACSGEGASNQVDGNVAEVSRPTPIRSGWSEIFSAGAESADAFRRMTLRNGEYKQDGAIYRSVGIPNMMADSSGKLPNVGLFEVQGSKDRVEHAIFTLELTEPEFAQISKERFAEQFNLVFQQLGVPGAAEVKEPILKEQAAKGTVAGADYSVVREAMPTVGPQARRLIVTFSRPGANPAATASPRNP
jgi:hypothetical protein